MSILAIALTACAATGSAATPPKPLFADGGTLRLTLQAPLTSLRRAGDPTAMGTLTVQGAVTETLPVKLSPRGITRRKAATCSFPPLWIEFTQKPGDASVFKGQKRLKLVTHCQPPERFQQYVVLEYAAYQLYRTLTAASFNTRLAMIDYRDGSGRPITTRIGFLIEDIDDVARRNGLKRIRGQERLAAAQLNPRDAARFGLFEYMIGNLDWSMTAGPPGSDCCHNARLIGTDATSTAIVPVPYDFDFAGLVDAPYAVPPAGDSAASVRVRRYRGYCRHNAEIPSVAAELLGQRGALLGVLRQTPELDAKVREKASAYLGGFFDQIGSESGLARLLQACIGQGANE